MKIKIIILALLVISTSAFAGGGNSKERARKDTMERNLGNFPKPSSNNVTQNGVVGYQGGSNGGEFYGEYVITYRKGDSSIFGTVNGSRPTGNNPKWSNSVGILYGKNWKSLSKETLKELGLSDIRD